MARLLIKDPSIGADAMGSRSRSNTASTLHQLGTPTDRTHDDIPAAKPGPDIEGWRNAGQFGRAGATNPDCRRSEGAVRRV